MLADVCVHAVSCCALPCVCGYLQAFQCSEQAVTLCKDGWFCPETEPSGVSKMRNPKEPSVTQPLIVVSECLCCLSEALLFGNWLVLWLVADGVSERQQRLFEL